MAESKPCLFLDRDGVIIKNVPYSRDPGTVELLHGAAELIKEAQNRGFWVIVITNQSGIGRGWISVDEYNKITDRMIDLLSRTGARIDRIYHAPFYAQSESPEFLQNSHWRKPEAGMVHQACLDYPIDLKSSVMVGDRASDILAAQNAGIGKKILLYSNDFEKEKSLIPREISFEEIKNLQEVSLPDTL